MRRGHGPGMKQPTYSPSPELRAAIDDYSRKSAARAATREVRPREQKPVAALGRSIATGKGDAE